MLDERARAILNLAGPNEIVILKRPSAPEHTGSIPRSRK
jgi:hypothetical protein